MSWVKEYIRTVPDYPKPGIMFRDVTSLMQNGDAFGRAIGELVDFAKQYHVHKVAGIDARGFILGGAVADHLGVGFIPLRKAGKLPANTYKEDYQLEYGQATLEMHVDAVEEGEKIMIIDDLIATGGTALAACNLIEKANGVVAGVACIIDLPDLGGSELIRERGYAVCHLAEYEGD